VGPKRLVQEKQLQEDRNDIIRSSKREVAGENEERGTCEQVEREALICQTDPDH